MARLVLQCVAERREIALLAAGQWLPAPEQAERDGPGRRDRQHLQHAEGGFVVGARTRFGLDVTILRPSHSYGEGGGILRPWSPWDTFVDRLRRGKPVVVPGDGENLWASSHVDDVAEGFIAVMGKDAALGECFNITGENNMTWNTYHQQVADVVGGSFDPVHIPTNILVDVAPKLSGGLREIFAYTSIFDNTKIKAMGYPGQTISLKEGTARTLAWMEANGRVKPADSPNDAFEDALIDAWRAGIARLPQHG